MQSEKAGDHNDHDHYADDVENIHCFAPIETLACSAAQAAGDKTRSVLSAGARDCAAQRMPSPARRKVRKLDQCLLLFFDLGLAALARRFVGTLPELVGVDL
jgi:hypothetical protein